MRPGRVLISGASVAGPALAVLLGRAGWDVTVVEAAPAPREGGYAVDFRGAAHARALEVLGVRRDLQAVAVPAVETHFAEGARAVVRLPGEFTGGDLNVLRRDLARVLREAADPARVAYRFGTTASDLGGLDATGVPVAVRCSDGAQEEYDLVVGADGLHSGVRRLAFGPDERFVEHLGFVVAGWEVETDEAGEALTLWNRPGRALGWSADPRHPGRANAFAVLTAGAPDRALRRDRQAQCAFLRRHLGGVGPRAEAVLAALPGAPDVYLDGLARARVPSFSRGRVALVGDAAHGATLGGMGTGAAVVGAAVLAHALARHDALPAALAAYEEVVRPYAERCARGGATAGRFFAPRTSAGILLRNRFFGTRAGRSFLLDTGQERSEGLDLQTLGSR